MALDSPTYLGQRREPRGRLWVSHVRLGGPNQQGALTGATQGLHNAVQLLGVAHLWGTQAGQDTALVPLWHGMWGVSRARQGSHRGTGAMGFDILQGLRVQTGWLVQGADELLLCLSRGVGDAWGWGQASAHPAPPDCLQPHPHPPQASSHLVLCSRPCWCQR